MDPKQIAIEFNHCINHRDIDRLEQLMTTNHTFIDSANNVESGKTNCVNVWSGFFRAFPDYKNHFRNITVNDNLVIIVGHSTCTDKILEGAAIWTAKIEDSKVAEWRVYEDTDNNRQLLGIKQ